MMTWIFHHNCSIETPSPPRQEEKPTEEPMETAPPPEPEVDVSVKQVMKYCVFWLSYKHTPPNNKEVVWNHVWVGGWFRFLTTLDPKKDDVF